MTEMTDELLARIAERATDPNRRYMTAAEDQSRIELPTGEIERRFDNFDETAGDTFRAMQDKMREWGFNLDKMSFVERDDGSVGASSQPPGATPLAAPPSPDDWQRLEQIVGRQMPDELKRLYSIADGGFGPGFTGLNPLQSIGSCYEDFRRRGPDYCGTVHYPPSFVPIAAEMLDYHYDLDTGRIISSNQDWDNDPLEAKDIYDIAFQSLAAMMEGWLEQS
jgi:hypothetical protein